jgi:hypothetical protein
MEVPSIQQSTGSKLPLLTLKVIRYYKQSGKSIEGVKRGFFGGVYSPEAAKAGGVGFADLPLHLGRDLVCQLKSWSEEGFLPFIASVSAELQGRGLFFKCVLYHTTQIYTDYTKH